MRRRRKRLRIDRILYVFVIFIILLLGIIFGIQALLNLRIYNSIKKYSSVTLFKQNVKVWNKTINYVNDNIDSIKIKYKKNYVELDSKKFKNGLNLKLNIYDKYIDKALFDNVKSLYIEKNEILTSSNKISIKLPRFLYKNNKVDIYGVKSNNEIILVYPGVEIKGKYVTFNINNNYDDYFITYIKGKSISSSNNINIEVDEKRSLNTKINPNNSTNKKLNYKYDKDIISLNGDVITGKKVGKTTIVVTSKEDKISKEIMVTVTKKKKQVIKEEKKKEIESTEVIKKDGITYVDGIMIVNKTYSLPSSYNPGGLTDEFMNAFYEMQAAASLDGISLFVASGFRDYDYQAELYNAYVKRDGKEAADTYSARPGYSEHQTGLAADINAADDSFNDTAEAKWLDKNCYKYGFIIRFPKGKEQYTGYMYESWHLRYVGERIAKKIHDAGGISLEEYYHLTSKYED
ncbi:MAG: M15 family metallopeptidase [Bacilli bacterium]|nr:M15 family metallopeptidase [Bacilli bacterium]